MIDLRYIIEQIPGYVYWCDVRGIVLGCNQMQAESFGLRQESEAIGKVIYDFYSNEEALFLREITQKVIETDAAVTFEKSYKQANDRELALLAKKVPLHDSKGNIIGILTSAVDISSQREAQQEQTWILEDIIGKMPGHVWWKDKNLLFMGCNDNQAKIAGLKSRNEIQGKCAYDVIIKDQPEEERRKQAIAIDKVDRKIIRTGKGLTLEEPLVLPDGKKAIYLSHKEPLKDRQGNIIGLTGIAVDITSEKEKVIAENKAKTLVALAAAGIAHELRTPLAAVDLLGGQLQESMEQLVTGYRLACNSHLIDSTLRETQIQTALDSGKKLLQIAHSANIFINMMLMKVNLEKLKTTKLTSLSIMDSFQNALFLYPFSEKEKESIEWDKEQSQDFIFMGDQTLFDHIIFNLLKNALYHIKAANKGRIRIWTIENKKHNILNFLDTGPGIPATVLPNIFDVFYTKTVHGTGVGLALCKAIMKEFGGNIRCKSIEGRYTHFILKFPKLKQEHKQ